MAAVFVLFGCGQAHPVQVASDPVRASAEQSFPPQSLKLANNVLFLWKPGVTATDMQQVSSLGGQMATLKMTLAGLLALQPPPPDLAQKVAALKQQLAAVMTPFQAAVDGFATPSLLAMTVSGSAMRVQLSGCPGPTAGSLRDLDSADGSIADVAYQELGGNLTFTAHWPDGSTYRFALSRDHYDWTAKGLVSFYGDVQATDASGAARSGIAHFAGQLTAGKGARFK
jgi:hypothetical protein